MAQMMNALNVGLLAQTPTFDVRNGALNTARNVYTRPTIGVPYHWIFVEGLAPQFAISQVGAFIRGAFAVASIAGIPGRTLAQVRKTAMCIGVSRAVMTQYYLILPNETIVGERVPYTAYTYQAGGPGAGLLAGVAQGCYVTAQVDPHVALGDAMSAAAQNMPDLTALEAEVCSALLISALGTLPLQGYSLINTNHHYLSEAGSQSRRAFEAIERQHWKAQDIAQWFADDLDMIRDAMWHKSGHPVSMDIKIRLAKDTQVPAMLVSAGAGSATPRLPAVETEMRVAGSYMALFSTCSALFLQNGGAMDFTVLTEAAAAVEAYEVAGGMRPIPAVMGHGPTVDIAVMSRDTAVVWLKSVLKRNEANAAYAYGFYVKMQDSTTDAVATGAKDTLRASYSLRKLEDVSRAAFMGGQEAFKDFEAASKARRAAGRFVPPMVVLQ